MLTATPELTTWLNATTQGVSIPVFTITLANGTVLRWARNPTDVSFGGTTWLAHSRSGRPQIMSYHWRSPVGLEEIGTCEVVLGCGGEAVIGSEGLQLAAARGVFKNARLLVERVYADTPVAAPVGKLFRWSGKVQSSPGDSHSVTLTAESVASVLRASVWPRTLVSPTCGNALYDTACGVTRVASSRTVQAGSTKASVLLSGGDADGYWTGGVLTFGSEKRSIRSFVSGAAALAYPLPTVPTGTVTVTRGCDRTMGPGGCAKFSNQARFRGMPSLPRET
jgi:hypothetical protein